MRHAPEIQILELRGQDDCRLRIVFTRTPDRWWHAVETLVAGAWQPFLESVEGSAADAWPAAPPLQHLHFEERPEGQRVALAVGLAGRSHWSASIEADPARSEIRFDVACRATAPPMFLGGTYRAAAGVSLEFLAETVVLHGGERPVILRATAALVERTAANALVLQPPAQAAKFPATFRWQYAFTLNSSPAFSR